MDTFQNATGAVECLPCPHGTTSLQEGALNCIGKEFTFLVLCANFLNLLTSLILIMLSRWFLRISESLSQPFIVFFGAKLCWHVSLLQVSISSKTIPLGQTSGTRLEGSKNPPPGQSLCTKTLPLGQNRESKAPPLGHKVRKFHECIYKLWHYLKWKALWSQQIKQFFNEERLIIIVYIIWRSPESNYWTYKSFTWYV